MKDIIEKSKEIMDACKRMQEEGLIARTWGNVSARISDDSFLITPSGKSYEELAEEDLVLVTIMEKGSRKNGRRAGKNRRLVWEDGKKPSSEKIMHAEIYRQRPECRFIIHTHQMNASAVSITGESFDLREVKGLNDESRSILGDVVPCAKYGLSSTKNLAKNVARAAGKKPASRSVLLRYHGAVLLGEDAQTAMDAALALEEACGLIYEKKTGESAYRTNSGFLHEKAGRSEYGFSDNNVTKIGADERSGRIKRRKKDDMNRELFMIHVTTPFVMEMARRGKEIDAYLDDMAQISGTKIECIEKGIDTALRKRSAVLVKNEGAFCVAGSADEAEAVALVLEKNCKAANLGLKKAIPPVPGLSAKLEHVIYTKKYSRLKNVDG